MDGVGHRSTDRSRATGIWDSRTRRLRCSVKNKKPGARPGFGSAITESPYCACACASLAIWCDSRDTLRLALFL
jgi:hypothetical protein